MTHHKIFSEIKETKQIQQLQKAQQDICRIEMAEKKDGERLNVSSVGNAVLEGETNEVEEEKEAKELNGSEVNETMESDDVELINDQLEQDNVSQGDNNYNGEQVR